MMSGSKSMRHTKKKEAYLMNLMFKIAYVVLYLWPLPTWEPFHMSIPSQATIVSLQDLENTHETNKIRSAMVKLDLFRDTFLELDPRLMNEFYGHGGFDLSRDAAASPSCKAKCPTSIWRYENQTWLLSKNQKMIWISSGCGDKMLNIKCCQQWV